MLPSHAIIVQLVGGELDGDTIKFSAAGSDMPPHQLSYLTTRKDEAAWVVYGCDLNDIGAGWPDVFPGSSDNVPPVERKYYLAGYFSLDYRRR